MGISAVLLAYKEAENLRVLLPQIKENLEKCGEDYEILTIDTATPLDDTKAVCEANGAVYVNQEEPHFGGAFRTGIKYASKDKFLIMDSDGSHNPRYIPDIYGAFLKNADVAIGSRYVSGGITNDSVVSRFMSGILNTAFRVCLGIRARDISTDFRMYHTSSLKNIELRCDNYDVLQEVLLKLKMNKGDLVIQETPISFDKRLYGETKRQLLLFIISYIKTLCRLTAMRMSSKEGKELLRQLALYGCFGLLAAAVDFSVFSLFNRYTDDAIPLAGNIIASASGFAVSFSLNAKVNFKKSDRLFKRFLSYFIICLGGMGLSTLAIYLLKAHMNLSLLKIICIAVVSAMQFVLNKLFTFRD